MPNVNNTSTSIRGDQGNLVVLENGSRVGVFEYTGFTYNEKQSLHESFYIGRKEPELDKSIMGYAGSLNVEIKNSTIEDLIERQNEAIKAKSGIPFIALVVTFEYGDNGAPTSSYLFSGCILNLDSVNVGNLGEKISLSISFSATNKEKV